MSPQTKKVKKYQGEINEKKYINPKTQYELRYKKKAASEKTATQSEYAQTRLSITVRNG
ncbi:hypothetical protein MACH26_33500 [Planctobacterium marinum]|uniref:Uncharacterized protein n=1 Tax=Planctobacterium marinum TaxID=1631968 RepID=A0AA48HTR8_9ALTE|nr:hypothetical protein MACH26_33500 [Planctobacterium marinum]